MLSRELTRAMGGNLRLVESLPGKGSTFEFTIRVLDLAQNPAQSLSGPAGGGAKALTGLRVLLVEDSPDNQFLISRILSLAGIEVALANDGVEGTELALSRDFDVILMDVQMPRMGGDEAVGKLRESGYAKPVIALTAHALKGDRERCLNAGFDDYLTKPIQRAALMDVLVSYART